MAAFPTLRELDSHPIQSLVLAPRGSVASAQSVHNRLTRLIARERPKCLPDGHVTSSRLWLAACSPSLWEG